MMEKLDWNVSYQIVEQYNLNSSKPIVLAHVVGTLYSVFAQDCPVDWTTIFVNPSSEAK